MRIRFIAVGRGTKKTRALVRSRLPFRSLFDDSSRQQTPGSAGQQGIISIMVVIIEGDICRLEPVVCMCRVFILVGTIAVCVGERK